METTRRRFMLGLGATGALAALPLPLVQPETAAAAASKLADWRAHGPLWGEIKAVVIGPIEIGDQRPADVIDMDGLRIWQATMEMPFIDVTSLDSTATEFQPCEHREPSLMFSGPVAKELHDRFLADEPIKGSFALPGGEGYITAEFRMTEFIVRSISQ